MLECPRAIVEPVEQVEEVVDGNEDLGELLFVVALGALVDDVAPIFGSLVKRGNEMFRYRLLVVSALVGEERQVFAEEPAK